MARKGAKKSAVSDVPDIYRDMLAEAGSSPTQSDQDGRSIKKRRVAGRVVAQGQISQANATTSSNVEAQDQNLDDLFEDVPINRQQVVQTESEDSADSDVNWEEVDLKDAALDDQGSDADHEEPQNLSIDLGGDKSQPRRQERAKKKPVTAAEKKLRLEVHKMHLCSLLVHVYIRNHWCNDLKLHSVLRKLLTKKLVSYLNPEETASQFQRSRSFMDGLQQASELFQGRFRITARGMAKGTWSEPNQLDSSDVPDDIDLPMQNVDFISAAKELTGSRDVGAQLFCALLRAAGVDARLVCSLQPLQFRALEKAATPQRKYACMMPADPETRNMPPGTDSGDEKLSDSKIVVGSHGGKNRFIPEPGEGSPRHLPSRSKGINKKPIRESRYPVYWIEAFNEAVQKWIPVDPLVTKLISKPSKFEPPAGERENSLNYVIAFEDDDTARDVTRRYAKAYNAKTRRDRVEVTKGGERWWKKVTKVFKRSGRLDRDQVEEAELASKEAAEPMPRNVLDFKDHPYYALERHLRRHEVIHPKREVGKIGMGRGHASSNLESIYRRRDVQIVQSADKWYRMGREVKTGEQPLKRVAARKRREASVDADEDMDGEQAGVALYSIDQTTVYHAPPVVDGRIPKNVYGNLDVYVPSMIPPGGAHIQHKETVRVARILGVDYAEAVTGFHFKGRHGTAITNGAVVPAETVESMLEVITTLEDERAILEQQKRTTEVLAVWKRLMIGLRIRERIEGYDIEGERDEQAAIPKKPEDVDEEEEEDDSDDEGGGFLPDRDAGAIAEPTATSIHPDEENDESPDTLEDKPRSALIQQRPPMPIKVVYGEPIGNVEPSLSTKEASEPPPQDGDLFGEKGESDEGGGFVPDNDDDDDAEATLQTALAQDLSSRNTKHANVEVEDMEAGNETFDNKEKGVAGEAEGGFLVEEEKGEEETGDGLVSKRQFEEMDVDVDAEGDAEDSDKGSLLSHDPEDEDVDPDF